MPDTFQVALLGVRHQYTLQQEEYLDRTVRHLGDQIRRTQNPVVALELSPRNLSFFLKLAENPRLLGQPQIKPVLQSPHASFWIKLVKYLHDNHKGIKLVALENESTRKYIFGVGRPQEFIEMAVHGVAEKFAAKKIKDGKVNIATVGTLHIEGYRESIPNSRIVYREKPDPKEKRAAQQMRKKYRAMRKRLQRGLPAKRPDFPSVAPYTLTSFTDADILREWRMPIKERPHRKK